jgi:hypothetical protein
MHCHLPGDIDLGFVYGNGRTPGSLWAQYVRHSRWPMRTAGSTHPRRGMRMGINGGLGAHRYPLVGKLAFLCSEELLLQTLTNCTVYCYWHL